MNERPERIFRGTLIFYLGKGFALFVAGLIITWGCLFPLIIIFTELVTTGWASGAGAAIVLLVVFATVGIRIVGNLLLDFPEIGVSRHYLWFRHFGVWQAVRWSAITAVDRRQQVTTGIYLYADTLPWYHQWTTANFGLDPRLRLERPKLKPGKALFIAAHLRGYADLCQLIKSGRNYF